MIIHSNGFGVQSVTIAAMACLGDLPMPDASFFADPGWEGEKTYEYAKNFSLWALGHGLKIVTVSGGDIRADALAPEKRWASMPLWTVGGDGRASMLRRQCTREYKISVIARAIRNFMGLKPLQRVKVPVTMWLGISLDEVIRMKESRIGWLKNAWPLIDKRMSRADCIRYLQAKKIAVPPKSACIGCPYRSDDSWRNMKENQPEDFKDAIAFDAAIRRTRVALRNPVYLHRSLKPLDQVDFKKREPDMFGEECEGHCGL